MKDLRKAEKQDQITKFFQMNQIYEEGRQWNCADTFVPNTTWETRR